MELPGVRPPGWEWRQLDSGSCGLRIPGSGEIRVATCAEVFDAHPESMALFTPGMPAMDNLIASMTTPIAPQSATGEQLPAVLVHDEQEGARIEIHVPGYDGDVETLAELLERLRAQ